MKKKLCYIGTALVTFIYVALIIICENQWIAWAVLGTSLIIGIYINMKKKRKKWVVLLIFAVNLIVFPLTNQISLKGGIISKIVVPLVAPKYAKEMMLSKEESTIANEKFVNEDWSKQGYIFEKKKENEVKFEMIYPEKDMSDKVIMYIHGGGFVVGIKNAGRDLAVRFSETAGGAMVILPDYTTSDLAPYPAALNDCIATYEWMMDQGYDSKNIILIGDSAGGNLILAMGLYLRDHQMPMPAGIIAISAFANMNCDTKSYFDNAKRCILGEEFGGGRFDNEKFYYTIGCKDQIENPYLSPVYGNYTGFPRLLLQVGSREIVLDDSETIAQNAKEAGVDATCTVYRGMWHVFQTMGLGMPEEKAAWTEIKNFMNETFE